ncbi:MAG: hypothetical protein H6922_03485 [Pseudomonadaceae bacterium]|nr:hypothetical protein [Pseudomonadaceae bacterium]
MTIYAYHIGIQDGTSIVGYMFAHQNSETILAGMSDSDRRAKLIGIYMRDRGKSSYMAPTSAVLGSAYGQPCFFEYWFDVQDAAAVQHRP